MEKLNIIMLNHININKKYINTDKNIKEFLDLQKFHMYEEFMTSTGEYFFDSNDKLFLVNEL